MPYLQALCRQTKWEFTWESSIFHRASAILAASILGSITKHLFNGHAIYTLVFGGISMIIAGLLTLIVDDKDDPYNLKKNKNKNKKQTNKTLNTKH